MRLFSLEVREGLTSSIILYWVWDTQLFQHSLPTLLESLKYHQLPVVNMASTICKLMGACLGTVNMVHNPSIPLRPWAQFAAQLSLKEVVRHWLSKTKVCMTMLTCWSQICPAERHRYSKSIQTCSTHFQDYSLVVVCQFENE